ncbi:MAG: discoidin domain-containing protein [Actinomycetota bacterium]
MQGDDNNNQFDDLFEPFELAEPPTSEQPAVPEAEEPVERFDPPPPPPRQDTTTEQTIHHDHVSTSDDPESAISCPSCGARNPAFNHHCERCGSRLSQDPMPIAPAPAARSTAGGRALGVLAAVVLLVALVALTMNIFRGGDSEVLTPDTDTSTTTSTVPVPTVELIASSATASSQLGDSFGPENLIDGNPETRWNDESQRGVGAWLEFTFATPVQIREIELQNVTDLDKFKQNYKIQGYTITVNDLNVPISGRLANSNEPQTVKIASLETIKLTIEVTTTHPAEPVGENPPFDELALQGIRFFGVEK